MIHEHEQKEHLNSEQRDQRGEKTFSLRIDVILSRYWAGASDPCGAESLKIQFLYIFIKILLQYQ